MANGASIDDERFKAVLGRFATGVGVMTTRVDGTRHAMTANAFSSVSLHPPLVLVCVERGTVMADLIARADGFAVSFLAEEQEELSVRFADPSRPLGEAQFEGVPTREAVTGAPVIEGALAWLDARVRDRHPAGDHVIVVGEVVALGVGAASHPLVYYRSGYAGLRTGDPAR